MCGDTDPKSTHYQSQANIGRQTSLSLSRHPPRGGDKNIRTDKDTTKPRLLRYSEVISHASAILSSLKIGYANDGFGVCRSMSAL